MPKLLEDLTDMQVYSLYINPHECEKTEFVWFDIEEEFIQNRLKPIMEEYFKIKKGKNGN